MIKSDVEKAAEEQPRRLFYCNGGFLRQSGPRQILEAAGYQLQLGLAPLAHRENDAVVAWGHSPTAWRAERLATKRNLPLLRVEDAFLRSVLPGRKGELPLGLLVDAQGTHFDSRSASSLETLILQHPLDDSNLLQRARDGISRIQQLQLSKYNFYDLDAATPAPGYVLIIDQTLGDASIRLSGATAQTFQEMLATARQDHPNSPIVIKTHPETQLGLRRGHFGTKDAVGNVAVWRAAASPWAMLSGAIAVYTVSSQMGFEAILAGHRPHVFGQPFYAGWGLSHDHNPLPRRNRKLSKTQLFAAAMVLAPIWFDPVRNALCSFEDALFLLEARVRSHREDRAGYVASGMRMWKRRWLQDFFGQTKPVVFVNQVETATKAAKTKGASVLTWGSVQANPQIQSAPVFQIEDGFLRSIGLGAALVPPFSLVKDDLGIYYDPSRESRLEKLIQSPMPAGGKQRVERLIGQIIKSGISKYNLDGQIPATFSAGKCILVPGQVEDDASIRLGTVQVCTNLELLEVTRRENPEAVIVYKPHPDVEAGLRKGAIDPVRAAELANHIVTLADPVALIAACDEVWTMTSLLGFEALMRDKPVVCLGAPFYAGWGLTKDLGSVPTRRRFAPDGHPLPRPDLASLVYATLIAYPRYYDPVTRSACSPEAIVYRLGQHKMPTRSYGLRLLAKLQGRFSTYAYLWR